MRGHEDEGVTWIVDEQPTRPVSRGLIIQFNANSITLGSGRLSMITRITRHWVSFKVLGISPLTCLRVPIPWAQLSQIEQYAHVTRYVSFPPDPPPSRSDIRARESRTPDVTPYDFNVDPEDRYLERQLHLRDIKQAAQREAHRR